MGEEHSRWWKLHRLRSGGMKDGDGCLWQIQGAGVSVGRRACSEGLAEGAEGHSRADSWRRGLETRSREERVFSASGIPGLGLLF